MTESENVFTKELARVIGAGSWKASIVTTAVGLALGLVVVWLIGNWHIEKIQDSIEHIELLIEKNKCNCKVDHRQQIHEQHVNVAPQWSREDTIREELKARRERQDDVRGIAGAEKPNGS